PQSLKRAFSELANLIGLRGDIPLPVDQDSGVGWVHTIEPDKIVPVWVGIVETQGRDFSLPLGVSAPASRTLFPGSGLGRPASVFSRRGKTPVLWSNSRVAPKSGPLG